MNEFFYIIRNDYHTDCYLYAMMATFTQAIQFCHENKHKLHDAVIECCEGRFFPPDYKVTRTFSFRYEQPLTKLESISDDDFDILQRFPICDE